MWTVTLELFYDIDGLQLNQKIHFRYAAKLDAIRVMEQIVNQMTNCEEKISVSMDYNAPEPKEEPVDWKE